ncbi:Meiotically up-regulated gene 184 protein [Cercospora zeina]
MVKPDLKHNYYQDLDLPTTASVDDVRKAYRKLALQFHPDRNAGREEECVPRFQAIQAANEILSDPTSKAKYDADRRKVGLYPSSFTKPSASTTGNPYAARSDFPPPPRRTQPGPYQRTGASAAGPQPTGADRFTHFARPNVPPQKNPAADRAQAFRAWQNMNQQNTGRPPPPDVPPRQAPPRSPQPPTPGPAPTSARPRPGRQETKMPTEEQIRAGMRYGKSAGPNGEEAANHQSAWQAFQQNNAGQPGVRKQGQRKQPPATPKRPGGFDPNAPGSDERAAPHSSHYVNRHKSEDFGRNGYPPPPPGPPPVSATQSPTSPTTAQRPHADPLRPFKSKGSNEDAPYAEGNRTSTPYSSYIGEKTAFNAENLRRSASVKDTTKLSPESAKSSSTRARSVDPATRNTQANANSPANDSKGNGFSGGMFSDSSSNSQQSSEDEDLTQTPEEMAPPPAQPSTTSSNTAQHGGPAARNIKTPKPPSRLFTKNGRVPVPGNDAAAHTDSEQPSMQERKQSANMYEPPSIHFTSIPSSFNRDTWIKSQFGTGTAKGGKPSRASVPLWAMPSSVSPATGRSVFTPRKINNNSLKINNFKPMHANEARRAVTASAFPAMHPSGDEMALAALRTELIKRRLGDVEQLNQLDVNLFKVSVAMLRNAGTTGNADFDACLSAVLARFPVHAAASHKKLADDKISHNSFSFPTDNDTWKQTPGKSRSVEEINTNFSPNGFHGKFEGSRDYFTNPNTRRPSPSHRTSSRRGQRAATTDSTPASNRASPMPSMPRRNGSDTSFVEPSTPFSTEAWQKTFSDGTSFAWPPPPPNPPASTAASRRGSRATKANGTGPTFGAAKQTHVVQDDEDNVIEVDKNGRHVHSTAPVDEGDAMDIDTPPQADKTAPAAHGTPSQPTTAKEPRLYSVEPSEWRQQQSQQQTKQHRPTSSSTRRAERKSAGETSFNVTLDDLRHTEPFATGNNGLKDMTDLSSSLPFTSKASAAMPTDVPRLRRVLAKPAPVVPEGPTRLSKTSWVAYTHSFANYLVEFHTWNKLYLEHFALFEKEAEDRMQNGLDWLQQSGDTVGGMGGFGIYAHSVNDEKISREAWVEGREQHSTAIKKFERMRERVKELAESGTLTEV